jgi:hypothetical protein
VTERVTEKVIERVTEKENERTLGIYADTAEKIVR